MISSSSTKFTLGGKNLEKDIYCVNYESYKLDDQKIPISAFDYIIFSFDNKDIGMQVEYYDEEVATKHLFSLVVRTDTSLKKGYTSIWTENKEISGRYFLFNKKKTKSLLLIFNQMTAYL